MGVENHHKPDSHSGWLEAVLFLLHLTQFWALLWPPGVLSSSDQQAVGVSCAPRRQLLAVHPHLTWLLWALHSLGQRVPPISAQGRWFYPAQHSSAGSPPVMGFLFYGLGHPVGAQPCSDGFFHHVLQWLVFPILFLPLTQTGALDLLLHYTCSGDSFCPCPNLLFGSCIVALSAALWEL